MAALQPQQAPAPERGRSVRIRRLVVLLLILLLVGGSYGGYQLGRAASPMNAWDPVWLRAKLNRPLDHTVPNKGFQVAGYYVDYSQSSYDSFRAHAQSLDQVISFSYSLTAAGDVAGKDPTAVLGIAPPAKRILLFDNIDASGNFSGPLARTLLSKPDAQDHAVASVAAKLSSMDAAGAEIDFEDIAPELRPQLTQFMTKLATQLHKDGRTLSIAVPAKMGDNPTSSWSGAFDYAALGSTVDHLMIMAYDEHYRTGDPGPVASLPWVEGVIRYAITVMPTKKIVLGVPLYGYDWGPKGGVAVGDSTAAQLAQKAGAKVEWDAKAGENRLTYTADDGQQHVVYYPDARSLQAKLQLANHYELQGIALWRLGFEQEADWSALPPRAP